MIDLTDITRYRKNDLPQAATVACQGIPGAYSQIAASTIFVKPDIMYMRTFDGVFRAVDNGLCEYGILPVENSTAGSVTAVYDLMKTYHFYIARSVKLLVSHCLLANKMIDPQALKELYTHEQAAAQCSRFIEEHPQIALKLCGNTATSAKLVAESGRSDVAAISSENCAALYDLTVVKKNFQNSKNNFTRFICIAKNCEIFDRSDKISIMLSSEHKAGALYEVIKRFAHQKLNLTKLESRPIPETDFEFMFYFDVQASIETAEVRNLLNELAECTNNLVFLGNYQEIT